MNTLKSIFIIHRISSWGKILETEFDLNFLLTNTMPGIPVLINVHYCYNDLIFKA